ncbi:hypothetical protein F2Q68_00045013 [Brassica cretica]|uniref:Uncharacterized protein n=1 Tax=Brassica cretica TaxID=69181 RepID=A0A8S9LUC3_BRACR|nr:hypothetical protein F2Q68_00045013 [Brassica cretica]
MAQDDAAFGAPGGEPTPTPEAAPPISADFMSSVMARLARQDEVQKTTNDQLVALVAALTAPDGQTSRPQLIRRRVFNTNPTEDSSADEEHPANRRRIEVILSQQILSSDDDNDDTPKLGDLRDVLKRKLESEDDNSSKHSDLRLTLDAKKSRRISTDDLDPKEHQECSNVCGEDWNKWVRELNSSDKPVDTYDGEEDSSADEEHPANHRGIEVILSQQTLSSDNENDDTPKLGDLRDVLKRKLESEDDNSSKHSDLRLMLDAEKSRRISTDDLDPKEHQECSNGDLRDKLNAGTCDLRILLNRSKPTDLRRRLEQAKMSSNATLSKNDNNLEIGRYVATERNTRSVVA